MSGGFCHLFANALNQKFCRFAKGLGNWAFLRWHECDWCASVGTFSGMLIDRDLAKDWNLESLRFLEATIFSEYVVLIALRALERGHVFYETKDVDIHLGEHSDSFASIDKSYFLWSGHNDCSV